MQTTNFQSHITNNMPPEVVQQIIMDLLHQSGLAPTAMLQILSFAAARVLFETNATQEIAREIINKRFPQGLLKAYEIISLHEAERKPGVKFN